MLKLGNGLSWCELNSVSFMDDEVVLMEKHGNLYRDIFDKDKETQVIHYDSVLISIYFRVVSTLGVI